MLKKLVSHSRLLQVKQQAKTVAARLADQHVSLAVTGLSRSGKTAFICSLVNQLLEANSSAKLPFFSVSHQNRLVGVKRVPQPNQTLGRFAYDEAMQNLNAAIPSWPASTNGISQIRLQLKYRHARGLRKLVSEESVLTLDITDYPGEWLLDLPLLDMDYSKWCQHFQRQFSDPKQAQHAQDFLSQLKRLKLYATADEQALKLISESFAEYLKANKAQGYPLIQPGRFVLPGDLKDAPILHFFPVLSEQLCDKLDTDQIKDDSNYALLQNRFELYKEQVVKPFYKQHFKRFDRQIVLVDCLSALNSGHASFTELQVAIEWLLKSFDYGQSNFLKRIIAPKIDKLVFAASKADQVTPEQHPSLVKLLESMVHEARQNIQYEGVATESTALAAIKASESGTAEYQGNSLNVLKAKSFGGEAITLFPGDVPEICPEPEFWQQHGFQFTEFAPPRGDPLQALPHMRLDQILEFVLADKLK